jgi:tRNA-dependent cyclodipeptide synthase
MANDVNSIYKNISCRGFRSSITPKHANLDYYKKFIYSVSIGAGNKCLSDIMDAYIWVSQKYPSNKILLGDGLYRITLRITENLSEYEAERRAKRAGDDLMLCFLRELGVTDSKVIRTTKLLSQPDFEGAFDRIDSLYETNSLFRTSVVSDAEYYVNRQSERGRLKISKAKGTDLSISYLKQEIAVYLLLAERGWLADIYLGREIPTLAKIMRGEIPEAPEKLKQRINIGLKKKRYRDTAQQPQLSDKRAALKLLMTTQLADSNGLPENERLPAV